MSGSHFDHQHPEGHAGADGIVAGSLMYAAPAGAKLGGAVALILATMLMPASQSRWLLVIAGILLFAMVFSLVTPGFLLRRMLLLAPFMLCVVLGAALQPGSGPGWAVVAAKSALCLTTVILLSNTTPFGAILGVLQRIGIPSLLITTMALMHRYLFVLADEMVRMRRARTSRTFVRSKRFTWSVMATVAGRLFERATERADRIYDAMCARGWKS